jgi:hypothetical protein
MYSMGHGGAQNESDGLIFQFGGRNILISNRYASISNPAILDLRTHKFDPMAVFAINNFKEFSTPRGA